MRRDSSVPAEHKARHDRWHGFAYPAWAPTLTARMTSRVCGTVRQAAHSSRGRGGQSITANADCELSDLFTRCTVMETSDHADTSSVCAGTLPVSCLRAERTAR